MPDDHSQDSTPGTDTPDAPDPGLPNATKLSISVPQCANPTGIVAPLHHCRGSETPSFAKIPFRAATVMER
jgi:hypothetical protein